MTPSLARIVVAGAVRVSTSVCGKLRREATGALGLQCKWKKEEVTDVRYALRNSAMHRICVAAKQ